MNSNRKLSLWQFLPLWDTNLICWFFRVHGVFGDFTNLGTIEANFGGCSVHRTKFLCMNELIHHFTLTFQSEVKSLWNKLYKAQILQEIRQIGQIDYWSIEEVKMAILTNFRPIHHSSLALPDSTFYTFKIRTMYYEIVSLQYTTF